MSDPDVCVRCGAANRMRYPGNDPEHGPAQLYCSSANSICRDFQEEEYMLAEMAERDRHGHELLTRLQSIIDTLHPNSTLLPVLKDAMGWIQGSL